ncbi:SH3 domain-containing protein [Azotosporobacter soli]|uniref:SH3 domain-containing protein n=1 Tax=Azotosporobacter soli TaxID=3055040 RepID=UPI0031FE8A8F
MRFIVMLVLVLVGLSSGAQAATDDKQALDYWLARVPEREQVLMNGAEIAQYNEELRGKQPTVVYDLLRYPSQVPGTALKQWLSECQMPEGYVNGQPMASEWKRQVMLRINTDKVKPMNTVEYGLITVRSHVRAVPTATPIFESATDKEFDQNQSTILNPGEGVVILQRSPDGLWLFVQSENYRGWLSADVVAVASDRKVWQEYLAAEHFIVVTGSKLSLTLDGRTVLLEMGSQLPLAKKEDASVHTVLLPKRDATGGVIFTEYRLAANADVQVGYLPYTTENVLRQAFKFKGQPYGWGGLKDSVDCSSLIMDVYRTFGFRLPRDADQQEASIGKNYPVASSGAAAVLDTVRSGSTLYMPGHTMLYLGKADGLYYVIHSLGSSGAPDKFGKYQRVPVMQVVVSDLSLKRKTGRPFIDGLTTVKEIMQ